MRKNILIIYAFPEDSEFSRTYVEQYKAGAAKKGHPIRFIDLSELEFDPILWGGYSGAKDMEKDLMRAQDQITWSDHIVFLYPLWWSGMPALLKGFLERTFLPGFAFSFKTGGEVNKLLSNKSAHIIVTMHSSPDEHVKKMCAAGEKILKEGILGFCGIDPVKVTYLGPIYSSNVNDRSDWLEKAFTYGETVEDLSD